jgi:hypothetical protein
MPPSQKAPGIVASSSHSGAVDLDQPHVADRAFGEQPAQQAQERPVPVVLGDEHLASGASGGVAHFIRVGGPHEGGLLDDHVTPGA